MLGEASLAVGAHDMTTYKLIYYPLQPGKKEGSIMFFNENVGEFWYKLNLEALPPTPMILPMFDCELGRQKTQVITIENPSDEILALQLSNTDPTHFSTTDSLTVYPFGSTEVQILYKPTALNHEDSATLVFSSQKVKEFHK